MREIWTNNLSRADINEKDLVIEVGPGIGTLTQAMAKKAGKVISVEIDKTLVPILGELLEDYNNIEIINEDILKVDINEIIEKHKGMNVKIVTNLPYNITTPIIMGILEKHIPMDSLTVIIKKKLPIE